MFLFGSSKNVTTYGVLIDIASGTVGVAIVESVPDNKTPTIVYAHRVTMRISKTEVGKEEHLRRIRETLFSAVLTLSQEGLQKLSTYNARAKISHLYVSCSSPWSYTIARNVQYENDEPFKITQSIIDDLIQSAENEILEHLQTKSAISENGFEVVERATIDVTINDYPVHKPLHLKGTTLGLSHIAGVIPKEIIESVNEVQNKLFPDTEIRAHTYMLIMYCVMRDIFPSFRSLCIVDVTAEAMEFGVVENNLLIENTFISFGSSSFVRELMETSSKPANDILTILREIDNDTFEADAKMKALIQTYTKHVETALHDILTRRSLPSDFILTAQNPYEKLFAQILKSALTKVKSAEVRVIIIDESIMTEISTSAYPDVYLALAARFFHKLHGCGEMKTD